MDSRRGAVDVVDEMMGRRLGEIEWGAAPGVTFLLGGQARRAARTQKRGRQLIVRSIEEATDGAPHFRTPVRPLTLELAQALAAELGVPQRSSECYVLSSEVSEQGPESPVSVFLRPPPSARRPTRVWVYHCAGDAYGLVLGDLLESLYNVKVEDCNELCLTLEDGIPLTSTFQFTARQVEAQVRRRWQQFEAWFDQGRFHRELPLDVRRASTVEAFDVEKFLRTFCGYKVKGVATK